MAKRTVNIDDLQDEVVSKKARKRQAKAGAAAARLKEQQQKAQKPQKVEKAQPVQPEDPMSQCALLCQENRWREAVLLVRQVQAKAERDGRTEVAASLQAASKKIEYSLRRQMAAAVIDAARTFLNKEYLLDVG